MKKAIEKIIYIAIIIFIVWFIVSYIEILFKNLSENPIYSSLNLIKMLILKQF